MLNQVPLLEKGYASLREAKESQHEDQEVALWEAIDGGLSVAAS